MSSPFRKLLIAGNWKLNKTIRESIELVTLLKRAITDFKRLEVVVCPPYTALRDVTEVLAESEIQAGAQDIYWEEKGAFTGAISASLVRDAGARFVIVGHSERRQFFHETNESVAKKTKAALANNLVPIVCVGESLAERQAHQTFQVIDDQLDGALRRLTVQEAAGLVVAYEPVWAIGTGSVATPRQAQEVHALIRSHLAKAFGDDTARLIRILYGGSVKPDNISDLAAQTDIDGALVGGASLDANGFAAIVRNACQVVLNQ